MKTLLADALPHGATDSAPGITPSRRVGSQNYTPVVYLVLALVTLLGYLFASAEWLSPTLYLTVLSVSLVFFLAFEVWRCRRRNARLWLANPATLSSIFALALPFGVTNFIFFLPDAYLAPLLRGLPPVNFQWMNKALLLTLLGAFAMWRGYHSRLGSAIIKTLGRSRALNKILRESCEVRMPVVCSMLGISFLSRLLKVWSNNFGYSGEAQVSAKTAAFSQYLAIGESLGMLAIAGLSLNLFSKSRGHNLVKYLLIAALTFEVVLGFLSGMKSQVIFPVLLVGLCAYIANARIPRIVLAGIIVALFAAYQIVEPFRILRHTDPNFRNHSLWAIAETVIDGTLNRDMLIVGDTPVFLRFSARLNLTFLAALAVEFKDADRLTSDDPRFLKNIIMSPAYAIVPRVVWPTKPRSEISTWFNEVVLEHNFANAVNMSPIGYLYFAGGAAMIATCFFFVGVWQRFLYDLFLLKGGGGVFVCVGLLGPLVKMPAEFHALIVYNIRFLIPLIVIQSFLFKR